MIAPMVATMNAISNMNKISCRMGNYFTLTGGTAGGGGTKPFDGVAGAPKKGISGIVGVADAIGVV